MKKFFTIIIAIVLSFIVSVETLAWDENTHFPSTLLAASRTRTRTRKTPQTNKKANSKPTITEKEFDTLCDGDPQDIIPALQRKGIPPYFNWRNKTLLMRAAEYTSNPDVINVLMQNAARFSRENHAQIALLSAASHNSNVDIVKYLINSGANVNARDKFGQTLLMEAVASNPNVNVIKLLIDSGAQINAKSQRGWTALMSAAWSNPNPDVIKVLINAGANIDDKDEDGNTALIKAADKDDMEYVYDPINKAQTYVHVIRPGKSPYRLDAIKVLIAEGANVNAQNKQGKTALINAAFATDDIEIIKVLLKAGANVNICSNDGITALMQASRSDYKPDIVKALINAGANIDAQDNKGWTALMQATCNPFNSSIVSILIEAGADPFIYNNEGKRALNYTKNSEIISERERILIEAQPISAKTFIAFCKEPKKNVTEELARRNVPINYNFIEFGNKSNLLMVASRESSSSEIIEALINMGADVNAKDAVGRTALMYAVLNPQFEITETLLEAGANVNIQDKNGETALIFASAHTLNPDIISFLIENGANIDEQAKNGFTALMASTMNPNIDILETLILNGADVNIKNKIGKRAIDIAKKTEVKTILKNAMSDTKQGWSVNVTQQQNTQDKFQANGSITGDKVNVRTSPNMSAKVVTQLNTGHPIKIEQKNGDWYFIQTASGTKGWVFSKYVKIQ